VSARDVAADPARVDELYSQVARFANELGHRTRSMKKQRGRIVRLEAAIRLHSTGRCACSSERECLARLYRLVPLEPRR